MKKHYTLLALIVFVSIGFAQSNINNYKYVLVPDAYEFLEEKDKYQLNSLTKFLFNKYGYIAFLESDPLPQDLKDNMCMAMYVNLENLNALFKIKVKFHLKDCGGKLIMSSKEGETKEKLYDKGYNIALRHAFETFQFADYSYSPNFKEEKKKEHMESAKTEVTEGKKHSEAEKLVVDINQNSNDKEPILNNSVENEKVDISVQSMNKKILNAPENDILYAQPIENGFQIVDTEPKKIMVLYKSGIDDVFIVEGVDAIVYKKNGNWIYEEYTAKLEAKILNIKF